MNYEEHILQSWHTNAAAWSNAIQQEAIESRRVITNKAIVDAILSYQPKQVLDVGCGEGWLCRALQQHGIATTGIDAIPSLIKTAREKSAGKFEVCSYQNFAAGKFISDILFDAAVFNFSLFGDELVSEVLNSLHTYLDKDAKLIIQTLHPLMVNGDMPYKDGWRDGSWQGFSKEFSDPAPWYFRTLESWTELFKTTSYKLIGLKEPLHPATQKPASVIFVCAR